MVRWFDQYSKIRAESIRRVSFGDKAGGVQSRSRIRNRSDLSPFYDLALTPSRPDQRRVRTASSLALCAHAANHSSATGRLRLAGPRLLARAAGLGDGGLGRA